MRDSTPTSPLVVLERAVGVHQALQGAGIRNVVGGALALGYHIAEGRGTQDIDINVLLGKGEARRALQALPDDIPWLEEHAIAIQRDGQVRIMWPVAEEPPMPLDLFFAEHEFHRIVTERALWVEMLDAEVPILTATDLVVFKALFDRGKDWIDIQSVVNYDPPSYDRAEAVRWLTEIVGRDDPRTRRVRSMEPVEEKPFRFPG